MLLERNEKINNDLEKNKDERLIEKLKGNLEKIKNNQTKSFSQTQNDIFKKNINELGQSLRENKFNANDSKIIKEIKNPKIIYNLLNFQHYSFGHIASLLFCLKGDSDLITDGLDLIKKLVNILENESQEKIDEILMNNEDNTKFTTITNNINNHGKETKENIPFKESNNTKIQSNNNLTVIERKKPNTTTTKSDDGNLTMRHTNNFTIEESNIFHPTPTPNKTQ